MSVTATPRRSLRRRLAVWMLVSTVMTMLVFAGALYAAFVLEENDTEEADDADSPETTMSEAGEQMALAMAVAAPFALAAAIGGALWLSRRALAPLNEVVTAAREVTTRDLGLRLNLPPARDEVHDLVVEFNRLFERLQRGFDALGRYATDASHELRTPLAVVVSELDVALRRPRTPAEWACVAERARTELLRLTRLVAALLELARAEGPPEREQCFELCEHVDLVLANLEGYAASHAVDVSLDAPQDGAASRVRGDPDAIATTIRNLVSNAIEHSPKFGRVHVTVASEGQRITVTVDDEGQGVPLAKREEIFLPLRRGHSATNPEHIGHGLGLAIATRFAARHCGGIEVGDSPGGGARFVLTLPLAAAAE